MNKSLKTALIISSSLSFLITNACNTPNTPQNNNLGLVKINEIPTKFVANNSSVNSVSENHAYLAENKLNNLPSSSTPTVQSAPSEHYNNSQGYYNPNNAPLNNQYNGNVNNNAYGNNYNNSGNVTGNNSARANDQYNQNIQPSPTYPTSNTLENKQYNPNIGNGGTPNSH
jgi:hypothetical protein